eukprot:jgi/Botrbrau1/19933/Bobra.0059s0050.1
MWVWAAIFLLGYNEMMALVYNPIWLLIIVVLGFFGWTVYQELDVDAEMQRGLLPGALALGAKFVPTVKSVFARTVETVTETIKHYAENPEEAQAQFNAVRERISRNLGSPSPVRELPSVEDSDSGVSTSNSLATGVGAVRQRKAASPGQIEMSSLSDSSSSTLQSPAFA